MNFFIGSRKDSFVIHNNAVKSENDYTPEEYAALLRGEEIVSEYDEDGNPIEWEFIED